MLTKELLRKEQVELRETLVKLAGSYKGIKSEVVPHILALFTRKDADGNLAFETMLINAQAFFDSSEHKSMLVGAVSSTVAEFAEKQGLEFVSTLLLSEVYVKSFPASQAPKDVNMNEIPNSEKEEKLIIVESDEYGERIAVYDLIEEDPWYKFDKEADASSGGGHMSGLYAATVERIRMNNIIVPHSNDI